MALGTCERRRPTRLLFYIIVLAPSLNIKSVWRIELRLTQAAQTGVAPASKHVLTGRRTSPVLPGNINNLHLSATASKPTNRKPGSLLLEEYSGFHFQTKWHCSNCNYQEGLP